MVAALAKKVASRPKFSLNIPPRELVPVHVARSLPVAATATTAVMSARQHRRTLSVSSLTGGASAPVSARSEGASPYRGAGRPYHQTQQQQQQQQQHQSQPSQPTLPFRASLVAPRLYVGNAVDAAALPALRAHNIHYVLNVAAECDTLATGLADCDIQVLHVPLQDTASAAADALREFPRICQFIDAGMRDPRGGAVLVHCLYGLSRSATAALAYLLAVAAVASPSIAISTHSITPAQPPASSGTQVCVDDSTDSIRKQQFDGSTQSEQRGEEAAEAAVYAALHAMQSVRPDVQPNIGFIGALVDWRARCDHGRSRM